jgi:hypothetical protein
MKQIKLFFFKTYASEIFFVAYNIMVKTELKIDIILIRLIHFKVLHYLMVMWR